MRYYFTLGLPSLGRIAYERQQGTAISLKPPYHDVIAETLSPLDVTDATEAPNVNDEDTNGQVVEVKQEATTDGVVKNPTSTTEKDGVNTVTAVAKVTKVAEVAGSTTIIIMADNRPVDEGYLHLSIQLNRLYANAHGYKFRYVDLNETDCSLMSNKLPPCKLYAVRDALHDPNIETVLYFDSDAVVTPKGRRISIKEFREANNVANASVIVPQDCDNYQMNTGVQIWDSNEKTHDLIDEFIERAKRYPKFPWEQQVMLKVWANTNQRLQSRRFLELSHTV